MLLNDGKFNGKQVLSKAAVIKMQQNYAKGANVVFSPGEAGNWGYGFGEWTFNSSISTSGAGERSPAVSSPGLFGSFPWVDSRNHSAGFLFCFNLKNRGRNERYRELKDLTDEALKNYR